MRVIDKPGIYDLSREEYDADPCVTPSLSASIAKLILDRSPAHARLAHPRLNPAFERAAERKFDQGNACHALLLGEADKIVTIAADDFRTKAAKEARDAAIAAGKLPMLEHHFESVLAMANEARAQLARHEEAAGVFDPAHGKGERTLVWQQDDTWCRARPDWMPNSGNICWDYKTTAASANPDNWVRTLYSVGGDIQPAFYLRGLRAVTGKEWHWRWVVQEDEPPYALSVIAPAPSMLALAEMKVERALDYWRWCLKHNRWPGYPKDTAYIDAPPWEESKVVAIKDREIMEAEAGRDLLARLTDWQAPFDWKKGEAA